MFILAWHLNGESSDNLTFGIGNSFRTSKELSDDKSQVHVGPGVHRVEGTACS